MLRLVQQLRRDWVEPEAGRGSLRPPSSRLAPRVTRGRTRVISSSAHREAASSRSTSTACSAHVPAVGAAPGSGERRTRQQRADTARGVVSTTRLRTHLSARAARATVRGSRGTEATRELEACMVQGGPGRVHQVIEAMLSHLTPPRRPLTLNETLRCDGRQAIMRRMRGCVHETMVQRGGWSCSIVVLQLGLHGETRWYTVALKGRAPRGGSLHGGGRVLIISQTRGVALGWGGRCAAPASSRPSPFRSRRG